MQEKHIKEAEFSGLKYLGKATNNNANYRQYECENGHKIDLQVQHVRRNNWKCKYCFEEKLKLQAESIGYELLGPSDLGALHRRYKKDCGCIEDLRHNSVASTRDKRTTGQVTCKTCYRRSMQKCADESNITLFENVGRFDIRIMFNSCGHYKNAKKSQVFKKNLVCRVCQEENYAKEAALAGLKYLGFSSEGNHYREYELPCGCTRSIRTDHAKDGSYSCYIHDDSHYVKPSSVYLLKITNNENSWLKLGYSKNIRVRVSNYGVGKSVVDLVKILDFDTGANAMLFERSLHRKYKKFRLNKKEMEKFHKSNGHTECYPLSMIDTLIKEMEIKEETIV
jgi:hypothetical protein